MILEANDGSLINLAAWTVMAPLGERLRVVLGNDGWTTPKTMRSINERAINPRVLAKAIQDNVGTVVTLEGLQEAYFDAEESIGEFSGKSLKL